MTTPDEARNLTLPPDSITLGDGTGNEVLVTGALFAMLSMYPAFKGLLDVTLLDDTPNAVEFGLDFMGGRYRATITKVDDE